MRSTAASAHAEKPALLAPSVATHDCEVGDSCENMGKRLRALREEARETQLELATAIGVREQAVGRWEKGASALRKSHLGAVCKHYGVTPEWLTYGVEAAGVGLGYEHPSLAEYLKTDQGAALSRAGVEWLKSVRLPGEPNVFTWHHLAAAWESQRGKQR